MNEFCPTCNSEKGPFVKSFCVNCFVEKNSPFIVPKEIEIEKCKKCGKVKLSGIWREESEKNLLDFLDSKVKTKELLKAEKKITLEEGFGQTKRSKVVLRGEIESTSLKFERKILLKEKISCCQSCSKVFGNYFEAVIQLRFEKKSLPLVEQKIAKVKKLLEKLEKKNSLARIIKVLGEKNGADLFIGSNKSAKKVVLAMEKTAKQKTVVSTTLSGFDKEKGKNKYRCTYCMRF